MSADSSLYMSLLVLTFLLILTTVIMYDEQKVFTEQCEAKNGIMIFVAGDMMCVKEFIEINSK